MSKGRRTLLWAVAIPVVVVVLIAGAWLVDGGADTERVGRNVQVAGEEVGGSTPEELRDTVNEMAEVFPQVPVRIDAGDFELASTAEETGLSLDVDATVEQVLALDEDEPFLLRPLTWVRSLFSARTVDASVDVDAEELSSALTLLEGERRTEPVEPTLEATPEGVVVVPGADGRAITVHDVVSALPREVAAVDEPVDVEVAQTVTEPAISDDEVQQLADRANEVTSGTVTLDVGDGAVEVEGARFRPAFQMVLEGSTPRLTMQPEPVDAVLDEVVPTPANPTGVRFAIEGGGPVPVNGEDAQICCGEDAADRIVEGLLAGQDTIELPTRVLTAAEGREWAAGLGVSEVIGSFTTNHACCESRVTNIQRMADILRGHLIPPGTTFSVNDTVGRRTVEKGFVEGGVIEDGEFSTDIGGGVSQFATTLFNAAFFGGLDIPDYKAHSKYISRYPFGREATLAYPSVDLKIRNDTPYGIVIWPSYTGTSIRVDLWSTRTAVGAQTGQNKSSGCGSVTTERTRTFTDGSVETDTFRANYDCE